MSADSADAAAGRKTGAAPEADRSGRAGAGSADGTSTVRVELPAHLRTLARVEGPVELEVRGPVTQASVLDALEARFPALRGTIRDHATRARRPFLRFFACQRDLSHEDPDAPLPEAVASGAEPYRVVGGLAGG